LREFCAALDWFAPLQPNLIANLSKFCSDLVKTMSILPYLVGEQPKVPITLPFGIVSLANEIAALPCKVVCSAPKTAYSLSVEKEYPAGNADFGCRS
jgi:hypothetical protein